MRKLNLEESAFLYGGKAVNSCHVSGALLGAGAVFIVAGIATGGIGFAVAGGLSAYFGGVTGFACAVS
ncbi:hypothetical protein [Empedobacter sp. UBA7252]|uniref:hypothetical protein n=1 Tax=Bacteroidota TaxID=976 RepID=UPI0025B9D6E3|nr:hypothetical protein [Empedobacter sp. UBA7252]